MPSVWFATSSELYIIYKQSNSCRSYPRGIFSSEHKQHTTLYRLLYAWLELVSCSGIPVVCFSECFGSCLYIYNVCSSLSGLISVRLKLLRLESICSAASMHVQSTLKAHACTLSAHNGICIAYAFASVTAMLLHP